MKRTVYKAGDTCHFVIADGSNYIITILLSEVKIVHRVGFLNQKLIWRHKFPYYIRSWTQIFQSGREILKLVLLALEGCNSGIEVQERLKFCGELLEYHNPGKYWDESNRLMG